ncbi:MAG: hypothetical protein WCB49_02935 [Gammaproteobacteria bacterium]
MENKDQTRHRLIEQYDKLAEKFNELYREGRDYGRKSMSVALDKAREQLTELGEFSAEHGEELKKYLARDLDQFIADTRHLGKEAREQFHPSRLGAGALASLADVLESTGNALHSLGEKTKQTLTYKTGELTSAGTLTCRACGQKMHLKKTGHIPPCSKCSGTVFNKGY